jgi:DNA (cytosine-5)-methyltransferase 1
MKMLDLFCGAGGSAVGYSRAGFKIVGVDIVCQENYPFGFIKDDAISYLIRHGHKFQAIHASPPCQAYSITKSIHGRIYPKLIEPLRDALVFVGRPYIIENVVGAPLLNSLTLCGLMFGLKIYRHRIFESNCLMLVPTHFKHRERALKVGHRASGNEIMTIAGHFSSLEYAKKCMGIDWMKRDELSQAIPPAYTEFLGKQLIRYC